VQLGDITDFSLGRRFDWIIAPYRVFQCLESDSQIERFFRCVREHLAEAGNCILNTFKPRLDAEGLREKWRSGDESLVWKIPYGEGELEYWERQRGIDPKNLVLYPELIYREKKGDVLTAETVLSIAMRCWYPEQLESAIRDRGFQIVNRWGGYRGETYGAGPELVVQFQAS
jgi:hypothetical protein